ncbi:uncharacterized protein LOC134869709, partial [Eleginops maclovinus]|uniref:uncharacterized protein LOC134869709 n=1 Tax=Eleginops maclovinus TaxID=56733 RepID=UPI0030810705
MRLLVENSAHNRQLRGTFRAGKARTGCLVSGRATPLTPAAGALTTPGCHTKVNSVEAKLKEVTREKDDLAQQHQNLEMKLKEVTQKKNDLAKKNLDCETDVKQLKEQMREHEEKFSRDLAQNQETCETKVSLVETKLKEVTQEKDDLAQQHQNRQTELKEVQAELKTVKEEKKQSQETNQSLEKEGELKDSQVKQLENDLEEQKERFIKDLAQKHLDCELFVEQKERTVEQLRNQLEEQKEMFTRDLAQNQETWETKVNSVEAKLKEVTREKDDLAQQHQNLEKELKDVEEEKNQSCERGIKLMETKVKQFEEQMKEQQGMFYKDLAQKQQSWETKLRDEDNKALGIGYVVEEDKLYLMASINFSRRRGKMRTGQDLLMEEVRSNTPDPLTRRLLLSQVAGLYDPIGLVTPLKQKGAILVRKAFQETASGNLAQNTWDKPLSEGLREEAIKLFEEYAQLGQVKFQRSLTPRGWKGKPWAITFSDGSDKSYGAVLYLRWETDEGIDIRLLESKAKLTPLDQKGDAVKAEVCGAVFAARLRKYVERHGRMEIERWFHLVDSQTVLGAIHRDSYGYQTFFANRIGEIQKSASVEDWWWIPGTLNIADTITRGAALKDLQETWQSGPEFLRRPLEEWPIKSAEEVVIDARDSISKLQRKAFSAVMTRGQVKRCRGVTTQDQTEAEDSVEENDVNPTHLIVCPDASETDPEMRRGEVALRVTLSNSAIKNLLEVKRFSCMSRLVNVVAWVRRAADRWLGLKDQTTKKLKWEASPSKEKSKAFVLNVEDCEHAFRALCLAAQEGITFPDTTLNRLVVIKDKDGLILCGGRIQVFRDDKSLVPILPQDAWISTLLAREAHNANHEGIAGTLLRMRRKAWVVRGRRIVKKVVDNCVTCRRVKAKRCQQIMSDLPPERTTPAAPFQFTAVDLFGPYEVKDEVKKRVRLKVWGIVFSCMASRAIHADIVSDMSAEGFMLAYQRFTSLRGHPSKVWSDPGTNFVGAKPALEDLYRFLGKLESSGVEEKAAKNGTKWSWKI